MPLAFVPVLNRQVLLFFPVVVLAKAANSMFLLQMHWEAYVRLVAVTILSVVFYGFYGQHHGGAGTISTAYQKINGGDSTQET